MGDPQSVPAWYNEERRAQIAEAGASIDRGEFIEQEEALALIDEMIVRREALRE